jgi:hypothetical protein
MSPLRQKMQDRMVLHGFSAKTQQAYVSWIETIQNLRSLSPPGHAGTCHGHKATNESLSSLGPRSRLFH